MIIFMIALFGLVLGSFINALVWRVHEQAKHKKPSTELSILRGRSMCPNCKHVLAWYDLLPVLSWVSLAGKCRYCKKSISSQYPLVEVLFAVLLVVSYLYWPFILSDALAYSAFVTWTILLTVLTALTIYDLKWMILPSKLVYLAGFLAVVFTVLIFPSDRFVSAATGSFIAGGFFWLIYQISAGKWIGGGDVRYGFVMGIILGWQKTLFGLMLAAYLGTAVILVIALMGKYHKKMRLPFGPFLITATYISLLFGQQAVDLYKRLSGL